MAVNPLREVTLSRHKMSRQMCFDATTAYVALNVDKWKTGLSKTLNDKLLSKITPYRLLVTTMFNVASGNWTVIRHSCSHVKDHLQKNDRTPLQSLQANYLTIVPAYIPTLVNHLKALQDAVDARDFTTANERSTMMRKLLLDNVADIPKDVLNYLNELPKISDICDIKYDKPSATGGLPKLHMTVKRNISDATLAKTFGNFLVYKSSGKPIIKSAPIEEVDE